MSNPVEKLVLGTVQFGLEYGINSAGRPSEKEVAKILSLCNERQIQLLDTAYVYGNSEQVLGNNWPAEGVGNFRIVTKLPPGTTPDTAKEQLKTSLSRLNSPKVYALLFHRFSDYQNNREAFDAVLQSFVREGLIQRFGCSLYSPEEAEWLIDHASSIDIVQAPYSVLDRRFETVFIRLKKEFQTEIHVRSVFLQGLYFKNIKELPQKLQPLKGYIAEIQSMAHEKEVSLATLLMSYPLKNPLIDGVLTGIDNTAQLEENLSSLTKLVNDLPDISVPQEHLELLNPANWKD